MHELTTESPSWVIDPETQPWMPYDDPHLPTGERGAVVQQLSDRVIRAHFRPGFSAPEHAHPFTTTYRIEAGSMTFGDGRWLGPGQVRAVLGGHPYGPETAHEETGCTVLVISEGPLVIDWTDEATAARVKPLDTPPHGPLGI